MSQTVGSRKHPEGFGREGFAGSDCKARWRLESGNDGVTLGLLLVVSGGVSNSGLSHREGLWAF